MFISTLEHGQPISVDTMAGNGEFIVRIPIGYDDDTDAVYSLIVALSSLPGMADIPGYELTFSIVVAAIDGSQISECWDGLEARQFLVDADHRSMVKSLIYQAATHLTAESGANLVHMVTHTSNLPERALVKFNEICAVFRGIGFRAGRGDSWHGQHIWMMERQPG